MARQYELLSVGTNAKTVKGDSDTKLTAILYMAPSDVSGYDVCPNASEGCRKVCLYTSGRGAMGNVQQARIRKTKMFFEDRDNYLSILDKDIKKFRDYCTREGIKPYIRLNGTSDINYIDIKVREDKNIFELYPDVQFYDYTKDFKRSPNTDNYYLLFSRSEDTSISTIKDKVKEKHNVAVVFDVVPKEWEGIPVIDGDEDDLRPDDPRGVIVGLKAKGKARSDNGKGFVVSSVKKIDIIQE